MADVRAVVPLEYTQFKFMRKFEYYNVVVQVCLLFVDDFKTYVYKWSKGPKVSWSLRVVFVGIFLERKELLFLVTSIAVYFK